MAEKRIKAMVKGKIIDLTPIAFKMAEKYFGAVKVEDLQLTKPIELTKPLLIPRVKIEKPEELTKKEPEVKVQPVDDVKIETSTVTSGDQLAPKVVKKPVTRKKK